MRAFVFLLILANLLFFSWSRGFLGGAENPDALRLQQQLLADQVMLVRDAPALDKTGADKLVKVEKSEKPEEKRIPEVCLQVGDLPLVEMVRIEGVVAEKLPAFRTERAMNPGSGHHWVFIPPLPSKADAEKKAGELKRLGVPEFFIVQEAGAYRFAISLGIFSSKEAATERLAQLREKGVRSAKVGERDLKPPSGTLALQGPEAQADSLRQALRESLPNSKPVACKIKATTAQ